MRVILRELAHAHQAVERAMRFVAVAAAIFVNAQRQVTIALNPLAEDEDVRRAIHRFQRHPIGVAGNDRAFILSIRHFVWDDEHVFAIFAPVTGLFPLAGIHHLRRFHFAIAGRINCPAHIGFKLTPHAKAIGMPKDRSMGLLLQMEQVHLIAQAAVVALGGFFQPGQMRVQLFLVQPAGAIDTAQLCILLIPAPISA